MLERAKACLKHGATRHSLSSSRISPRSKRMLHSTFWDHGAGNLDLPPWALTMFPMPSDLHSYNNDNTRRRSNGASKSGEGRAGDPEGMDSERVFLDFLYPPQTIAWLQQARGKQLQRWEKRNARRLPEGFVVASRGYASRSQGRGGPAKTLSTAAMNSDEVRVQDSIATRQRDTIIEDIAMDISQQHTEQEVGGGSRATLEQSTAESADDERRSPSQETEAGDPLNLGYSDDAAQNLRDMMTLSRSGRALNRVDLLERAMNTYDSLADVTKDDVRLKRELVEWLSMQASERAASRCIEIYNTIPSSERHLSSYQAAVEAMMLAGGPRTGDLKRLQREAMERIENGYQVSRTLLQRAIEKEQWDLAVAVEEQHRRHYEPTQPNQVQLLWMHVSERPGMLLKAIALFKFASNKITRAHMRKFAASFFKEAITQEYLRREGTSSFATDGVGMPLPTRIIRRLLAHIGKVGHVTGDANHDPAGFYEMVMQAMLQPQSRVAYRKLHHIISFLYAKNRKMNNTRPVNLRRSPSEEVLYMWLRAITKDSAKFLAPAKSTTSMSLGHLASEWTRYHGQVSLRGVKRFMIYYARLGLRDGYEQWLRYLRSTYPAFEDQKNILWTMIWVHAKVADLDSAQQAFAEINRMTREQGTTPDLRCWNMLLLAHARADDAEGAVTNFQNLMQHGGLRPDRYSFQQLLFLFAQRGDVAAVEKLLRQYRSLSEDERDTAQVAAHMSAQVENGNVEAAERILQDSITAFRSGEIVRSYQSITDCFNVLLRGYSLRRDLQGIGRTYRWMKEEGVFINGASYAAVLQALVKLRQPDRAWGFLKRTMPKHNVEPTAFHYAIVMAGFVTEGQSEHALVAHRQMLVNRVRPSVSTHLAYLKAMASIEHARRGRQIDSSGKPVALQFTVQHLKVLLQRRKELEIPPLHPLFGISKAAVTIREAALASYFAFLVELHGRRQCFEAVRELHRLYEKQLRHLGGSDDAPPIELLAALAWAYLRAHDYKSVEECWDLAKGQADRIAPLVTLPVFKPLLPNSDSGLDALSLHPPTPRTADAQKRNPGVGDLPEGLLGPEKTARRLPLANPRRLILSQMLRVFIRSLAMQGRISDAIRTVTQVLTEGYTMDNVTWNAFIRALCRETPPLALLAFVLTERFLTPNFPGWLEPPLRPPRPSALANGLQYTKTRIPQPGELTPRYDTLVRLAGTLVALRRLEARGRRDHAQSLQAELVPYVGSLAQIHQSAPQTVAILQSMPRVNDRLQTMLLRGDSSDAN